MVTVRLGCEGEYGRRLSRFLETHLDKSIRLSYYTQSAQWDLDGRSQDLLIMDRRFYRELSQEQRDLLDEEAVLWITEGEEETGYCRLHPPGELIDMIAEHTGTGSRSGPDRDSRLKICGIYSPVPDAGLRAFARARMREEELFLGMEDMPGEDDQTAGEGHMGDLCYYIHLKDPQLLSRIRELSGQVSGYYVLPSALSFLPLLELSEDDYSWFFSKLLSGAVYPGIYVGLGNGLLGTGHLMKHFDSLYILSSREDRVRMSCCDYILQSVQAGYENLRDRCHIVFREDYMGAEEGGYAG